MFKQVKWPALALAALVALSGCSTAASSPDKIGIVRGDGSNDARVRDIIYPGEKKKVDNDTDVTYIPGGSRNYVISGDTSVNPDRTNPATGRTSTGTPVNVYLRASWTVNQDKQILMEKFVPFCGKYECDSPDMAADRVEGREATAGWVNMLDAEMSTAIDSAVRNATRKHSDTIWQDQEGWDELAADVAAEFPGRMRANTGYTDDLFCGSGDISFWEGTPGTEGSSFTCGPVLFEVTSVQAANARQQQASTEANAAEQQVITNEKLLEAAVAKYGDRAGDYLGQLDLIEACKNAGATCTIVIGGQDVTVPAPAPAGTDDADAQEE